MRDVDVLIHAAQDNQNSDRDLQGVREVIRAAQTGGVRFVVYLSVVGAQQLPSIKYFATKMQGEQLFQQRRMQSLIFRATQFHHVSFSRKKTFSSERNTIFSLIAGYRYRSQAVLAEDAVASEPAEIELLEKPEELTGQPGTRVPHLWLERGGQRISTLDLFDGRFVLLAGPAGAPWCEAASGEAADTPQKAPLILTAPLPHPTDLFLSPPPPHAFFATCRGRRRSI